MEERVGRISFRVLFFRPLHWVVGFAHWIEKEPGKRSKSLFSHRFIYKVSKITWRAFVALNRANVQIFFHLKLKPSYFDPNESSLVIFNP